MRKFPNRCARARQPGNRNAAVTTLTALDVEPDEKGTLIEAIMADDARSWKNVTELAEPTKSMRYLGSIRGTKQLLQASAHSRILCGGHQLIPQLIFDGTWQNEA